MARHVALLLLLAVPVLLCASGCGPGDPMERAQELQRKGRHGEALELLSGLAEQRPSDGEVQYFYALSLAATGRESLAKWPLLRAMESEAWLERAGVELARVTMAQGRVDEAIEIVERVLEAHPENHAALLLRAGATVRSRRGDYEAALADAETVLEADPDHVEALVLKTVALLALQRVEEANEGLEMLEEFFREDTLGLHGSPHLCAAQATFLKEKGEPEAAEERFRSCLQLFPDSGLVLAELVRFYEDTGRRDRAEEELRKALESRPDDAGLRASLVERLAAQGRDEEVERLLEGATEVEEPSIAAAGWFTLGLYRLEQGDPEASVEAFERAVALDVSGAPELRFAYADALAVAGRYDEALRVADGMSVPAHRLLVRGRVELERDRPGQALEHFTEANRIWPDNAVARYYTALAAERLGRFRRAIEDYRYSMRVDSKITDAYLRLARLQAAAGQYEAALTSAGFQPGNRQSEQAGRLLSIELLTRLGRNEPRKIWEISGREGSGAAAVARGLRARSGPEEAVAFLTDIELDLASPENAAALGELADALAASGRAGKALERTERAVAKSPDTAVFHALHGRARAASGDSGEEVRRSYERALELDPEQPLALAGLAALEQGQGQLDTALALFERAAASDVDDRASARAAAALLARLGRGSEAEARLESLLKLHPYDAEAALALAELRLARGVDDRGTHELARRAVSFGGGEPARALAERLGVRVPSGYLDEEEESASDPSAG